MNDSEVFPKDAFHNDKGMFTIPDPEAPSISGGIEHMVELTSGIFAPRPKVKEHRIIWVNAGAGLFQYEVEENVEECKRKIALAQSDNPPLWIQFTEPVYGYLLEIPSEALRRVLVITHGMKDIEDIEMQQKSAEYVKRMSKLQQASQAAPSSADIRKLIPHPKR